MYFSLEPQVIAHLTACLHFSSVLLSISFVYVIPRDLSYKVRGHRKYIFVFLKLKLTLSDCFIVMAKFIAFQIYFVLEFLFQCVVLCLSASLFFCFSLQQYIIYLSLPVRFAQLSMVLGLLFQCTCFKELKWTLVIYST